MIKVNILIYTAVFFLGFIVFFAFAQTPEPNRGCIASAYQAEMRGFDLQENLDACQ